MTRIAVVEDDLEQNRQLCGWILRAVPNAIIDPIFTKMEAIEAIRRRDYDLMTLDIELGPYKRGGFGVMAEVIASKNLPVIVISGQKESEAREQMIELHAKDYLTKPCVESEVIQKVLLLLDSLLKNSDLTKDTSGRANFRWKGRKVDLTLTERLIVQTLHDKRNEPKPVVTKEELLANLRGGSGDSLYKHIANIKKKLREVDPQFDCIQSVVLKGYQWVERD